MFRRKMQASLSPSDRADSADRMAEKDLCGRIRIGDEFIELVFVFADEELAAGDSAAG